MILRMRYNLKPEVRKIIFVNNFMQTIQIANFIKIGQDIYENESAHALQFETGNAKYNFCK